MKNYGVEKKLDVLQQGLRYDRVVVALCKREGVPPTTYYMWRRQFLDAGTYRLHHVKTSTLAEQVHRFKTTRYNVG
ncbi:transposase [Chloroflexota bacterium]